MARFKKRKWGSEKPNDTEKKDLPPTDSDLPPTDSDLPPTDSDLPPTDSEPTESLPPRDTPKVEESGEDKSATKKLTDRLFWMRIVFAVLGGIIATFVLEDIADSEQKRWTSIGFMIMIFISTIVIAKTWGIRIPRKKYVTTGIGSFIFLYLFSWIVSYTIANLETDPGVIPFP